MNNQVVSPIKNLWFAFIGAIAIYVFIGYQSLSQENKPIALDLSDLMESLFVISVIVALLLVAVAHSFLPKLLMRTNDAGQKLVLNLMQFALSEVAGIIGIILFFSKGSFTQLLALCAIAFISLIKLFPREI